jgi:nucleoside 2-deoxyribosyltransferase
MIITICSSIDFTPKILEIKLALEKAGHKVNIPYYTQKILDKEITYEEYMKTKDKEGDINLRNSQKIDFIDRHWNLIKNSDAILVINEKKKGIDNYIGGNTLMEMGFAYVLRKKIYLLNPIPERSNIIHYVDEIIDLKPIILESNLSKINP